MFEEHVTVTVLEYVIGQRVLALASPIPPGPLWRPGVVAGILLRKGELEPHWEVLYTVRLDEIQTWSGMGKGRHLQTTTGAQGLKPDSAVIETAATAVTAPPLAQAAVAIVKPERKSKR